MTRPWLVVATTGRALAASARRDGIDVVVLDCFGDRDTRAMARATATVSRPDAPRFDASRLRAAAARFPASVTAGLVTGSGLEGRRGLLRDLARGRRLAGNPAAVVRQLKEPDLLFPLLTRLGIPHPRVTRTPPDPAEADRWLCKRAGGAGGTGVRVSAAGSTGRDGFYQEFLAGRACSVIFLADGRHARVVGWNEQWTSPTPSLPFLYGGAVAIRDLPADLVAAVEGAVTALVRETGMIGLNGIDFIVATDRWGVIEVNPRPTATLELHDPDVPGGLFRAHLDACEGRLSSAPMASGPARAHRVVFAPSPWTAPDAAGLPEWCRDIPSPGVLVPRGAPLCTVVAEAPDPAAARALVDSRAAAVREHTHRAAMEATVP